MNTLICGSMAYDTIMVFHDRFKNHILPDQIHILNVSFLVPDLRREYGGCAGNIAYNLSLLGGRPLIMATVGDDFPPYSRHLDKLHLEKRHIRAIEDTFTAQAFIMTDLDDNQITAFHPGAMSQSQSNHVKDAADVSLGIIAPDGRDGMVQHAAEFHAAGIPFIFDPGQGLPMFSGEDILGFIAKARYVSANAYEAQLIQERTGRTIEDLAAKVEAFIVTNGSHGSTIHTGGRRIEIPCVQARKVVDPTGCGDAYRSGLLFGIANGWDWTRTGRLASVMGSIKVESRGGQNHHVTRDDIATRYRSAFGDSPW